MTIVILLKIIYMPLASLAMEDDLTIVATNQTFQEAQEWVDFLRVKEIPLTHVTPQEFINTNKAKYIVLMGGIDEPDGIRDILKKVLSKEEFQSISRYGNGKMFKKNIIPKDAKGPDMWASAKNYIIFTGDDRAASAKARKESKDLWWEELSIWFDIDESSAVPPY
jgi:hypothetical protein